MNHSLPIIKAAEIREATQPFLQKNLRLALGLFLLDYLLFLSLLVLILWVEPWWGKALLALPTGLCAGWLFIIGHDCCHQSFTPHRRLNRALGILAFLPTFHNFRLWELGHNRTHHAYTNLKSKDYVYRPLSPAEFRQLPFLRRLQYRLYRSIAGHLFYYLIEIWFKKMLVPHRGIPLLKPEVPYLRDSFFLLLYLLVLMGGTAALGLYWGQSLASIWLFTILVPLLTFNWAMGFIIYQHHTNPLTRWYQAEAEWHYWEVQMGESVHLHFPRPFNFLLHNIMEHTAHHSNMNIPLYQLKGAQATLEDRFGERIQIVHWTPGFYWRSIRSCKLYDYDRHQWVDFRGKKTK